MFNRSLSHYYKNFHMAFQNGNIFHIIKVYIYTVSWAMKKIFFFPSIILCLWIYLKEVILKEEKARYTKILMAVLASLKLIPVCLPYHFHEGND